MSKNCEVRPRPKTVKEFFNSWYFWKPFLSAVVGGSACFAYYYFEYCSSGTCAITSNLFMSIAWGAMIGYFIVNSPCRTGKC